VPSITDPSPCPVCGFDAGTVGRADAVVALRTFPRRFRSVLTGLDERHEELVQRRPALGEWSALEHAAHVESTLARVRMALERVAVSDEPSVSVDGAGEPDASSVDGVLERLTSESDRLATAADAVHGKDWARTGRLPGGQTVTALDLVRHAAHVAAHHLRLAQRALDAARAQR